MKAYDWENAFPAVPGMVHQRLESALKEKNEMQARKMKRPMAVLALALVLAAALMGMAYAASRTGILDYLAGGEEKAPDALKNSVQPVNASAEADGIRIDLTGAVFDGDRLALSFTMENTQPESIAMVTLDTVTLDGEWLPISFQSFQEQWLPDVFSLNAPDYIRNPLSGGMLSSSLETEYTGVLQGEATFVITRPVQAAVVIDPWMWYDEAVLEEADMRADYRARKEAILHSGLEIADVFHMEPQDWLSEGYTALNIGGGFLLDMTEYQYLGPQFMSEDFGSRLRWHAAINREGQMTETARITLPFTLDADAARAGRREADMPDVQLSNCTVHFESIVVSPLSTLVRMRLYPLENTLEAALALGDCYGCPWLDAPDGQGLSWLPMDGEGDACADTDEAGRYCYQISIDWGGMMEMPDALGFSFGTAADAETERLRQAFSERVIIPLK